MILVDTSIWIDHLRASDERLARMLDHGQVLAHPFVTGELALSNLCQRNAVLSALQDLPQACVAPRTKFFASLGQRAFLASALATSTRTF